MPCLGQEGEGKACRQPETVFLISAALIELQLQIGGGFGTSWEKWEIRHPGENPGGRRNHGDPLQTAIRQTQPLLFLRTIERKRKSRSFPLPLLRRLFSLHSRRDDADGKRREYSPRVAEHDAAQHRTCRKNMFRQVNV